MIQTWAKQKWYSVQVGWSSPSGPVTTCHLAGNQDSKQQVTYEREEEDISIPLLDLHIISSHLFPVGEAVSLGLKSLKHDVDPVAGKYVTASLQQWRHRFDPRRVLASLQSRLINPSGLSSEGCRGVKRLNSYMSLMAHVQDQVWTRATASGIDSPVQLSRERQSFPDQEGESMFNHKHPSGRSLIWGIPSEKDFTHIWDWIEK